MAVQTSDHTPYWDDRVSTAQRQLEALMRESEKPVYHQENPSVDLNELYNGMAVQTSWDNIHSNYWYDQQEKFQKQWDMHNAMEEAMGPQEEVPEVHKQTIDQGELYNGMAVQLNWENIHSPYWYAEQEKFQKKWDLQEAMEEAYPAEEEVPEVHRQTVDQGELYNGMAVQLGWENIHSPYWYDQQEKFQK
jgi:hypothetical protein